jgi:hypothetical protein
MTDKKKPASHRKPGQPDKGAGNKTGNGKRSSLNISTTKKEGKGK